MRRTVPVVGLAVALTIGSVLASASAQGAHAYVGVLAAEVGSPQPWVRADELARLLGAERVEQDGMLVLRTARLAVTMFDGSADALLAGKGSVETSLSAPAERRADGWWLPLDAGAPFGLRRTGEEVLQDASGRRWRLQIEAPPRTVAPEPRATVLRPAAGFVAVEIVSPPDAGGSSERAVWIADLALVPLLRPELREVVDASLTDAGAQRALLLIGTSQRPGASLQGVAVTASGRQLLAAGARHDTLVGSSTSVGPSEPWIAVVWLPPGTRLDAPLVLRWEGAEVEVTLRR